MSKYMVIRQAAISSGFAPEYARRLAKRFSRYEDAIDRWNRHLAMGMKTS